MSTVETTICRLDIETFWEMEHQKGIVIVKCSSNHCPFPSKKASVFLSANFQEVVIPVCNIRDTVEGDFGQGVRIHSELGEGNEIAGFDIPEA